MRNLQINSDVFHLPSGWNDLKPDQFLRVAELALHELPVEEFRLKMFLNITGLRVMRRKEVKIDEELCFYLKHGNTREYLVSTDELTEVCKSLDFMFTPAKKKDGTDVLMIHCQLYRQLIPKLIHQKVEYAGPDDGLSNILFAEYIHAETSYQHYQKTRKQKYVDRLIAVLYRPIDTNATGGDKRIAFNDHNLDEDASKLSGLDPALKNAIYMWYEGCRSFLVQKFPEVYSGKTGSPASQDVFENFMYLVNALTDNDVTKTDKVRQSYLMEVMITLNAMARQREEMEKKLKKQRIR